MRKLYILLLQRWNLIVNLTYRLLKIKPKVKGSLDTLDYILKHCCSVSRYGDGELLLMNGWYIGFQKRDSLLQQRLKEIIGSSVPNHIVCLPCVFEGIGTFEQLAGLFWEEHLKHSLRQWCSYANLHKQYYDTQMTRFYMDIKDKAQSSAVLSKLKQIWQDREVVFVEGEKSRMGFNNDLFANAISIQRILCPAENAFSSYEKILATVREYVAKDKLVLIALGPTATVLAYDLSISGYQAIDLGHLDIEYEWFKRGATEKCAIDGKYVNEVNQREIPDMTDEVFLSQVLATVK